MNKRIVRIAAGIVLTVIGLWLLLASFCFGTVAYELAKERLTGRYDGPTAMWLSVGGPTIVIEHKMSHIVAHGATSLLALSAGIGLLSLSCKRLFGAAARWPERPGAKPASRP